MNCIMMIHSGRCIKFTLPEWSEHYDDALCRMNQIHSPWMNYIMADELSSFYLNEFILNFPYDKEQTFSNLKISF